MNLEQLLAAAKRGAISKEDTRRVAAQLQANPREPSAYTLLHILGRSGAVEYRTLVEQFLVAPWDPMVARIALQVLCSYWDCTEMYLGHIDAALRGFPWDREEDVKLIALSISGEYLRSQRRPELLKEILRIFSDESEDQTLREAAYVALARAVGREWKDVPLASKHFNLTNDIDRRVLDEVIRMLQQDVT